MASANQVVESARVRNEFALGQKYYLIRIYIMDCLYKIQFSRSEKHYCG